MNYRHHFHAGNFADVMKHALMLAVLRGLQRKDKGFLYLDTHAGRGRYDLSSAFQGDSLARKAEWPDGIGRLWQPGEPLEPAIASYVETVRGCDQQHGNPVAATSPRFYPGSPLVALAAARPQDRLALCEKHPEECAILREEFSGLRRTSVHELDGYAALRAMLPPPERRALVLIDPPYEDQDEFARIADGLAEALRRFASGTYAVWYPLTERARVDDFFASLRQLPLPPTWVAELSVAGEQSGLRMRGCGLVVLNPPWQADVEIQAWLPSLGRRLAQDAGAAASLRWLVGE